MLTDTKDQAMSNEALRKAVEYDVALNDAAWAFVEAMPARLPGAVFNNIKPALKAATEKWLESNEATHRANYNALVIRLGEVTTRLEASDGTLRDIRDSTFRSAVMLRAMADRHLSTNLKATDHV